MITEKIIILLASVSNSVMFMSAAAPAQQIPHTAIDVSLSVFIGALLATGSFVWALAKYDASRTKIILKTEIQMQMLLKQLEQRHEEIARTVQRSEETLEESRRILRSALGIMEKLGTAQ